MPPEAGTASNDMTLARMEKIMQKYGVEVEWEECFQRYLRRRTDHRAVFQRPLCGYCVP